MSRAARPEYGAGDRSFLDSFDFLWNLNGRSELDPDQKQMVTSLGLTLQEAATERDVVLLTEFIIVSKVFCSQFGEILASSVF